MKSTFLSSCLLLLILVTGCNSGEKHEPYNDLISQQSTVSARQFVESEEHLDLERDLQEDSFQDPTFIHSLEPSEIAILKAAVYRFYKHVEIENGLYNTGLNSGDEINISDHLFVILKNNLEEMNKNFALAKKSGKIEIPEVSPQYLESILE